MATFSKKMMGKEVGDAKVYAKPHTMTGKEVKDRIDVTEWAARTDAQKQIILALCNRDDLNPFGIDATIFQDAMAGATNTLSALNTYRVESISRGEELDFGVLTAAHIDTARRTV